MPGGGRRPIPSEREAKKLSNGSLQGRQGGKWEMRSSGRVTAASSKTDSAAVQARPRWPTWTQARLATSWRHRPLQHRVHPLPVQKKKKKKQVNLSKGGKPLRNSPDMGHRCPRRPALCHPDRVQPYPHDGFPLPRLPQAH